MATRTIKTPSGVDLTISSEDAEPMTLALAEVLLELSAEQGHETVSVSVDELARRIVGKGFDPDTGNYLN